MPKRLGQALRYLLNDVFESFQRFCSRTASDVVLNSFQTVYRVHSIVKALYLTQEVVARTFREAITMVIQFCLISRL